MQTQLNLQNINVIADCYHFLLLSGENHEILPIRVVWTQILHQTARSWFDVSSTTFTSAGIYPSTVWAHRNPWGSISFLSSFVWKWNMGNMTVLKTIVLKWLIHTAESIVPLMFTVSTSLDLYLTTNFLTAPFVLNNQYQRFLYWISNSILTGLHCLRHVALIDLLNQTALEARRSTRDYVEWGQFKLGWKKYWAASDHVHRCIGDHMGESLGAKMSYTLKGSDRCQ